ncbi:31926_t:CDS:2, partial [Gigaspora margarita]
MVRIRKDEIPSVTLLEVDYENYREKFPSHLKRGVSFSNQVKIHDTLRAIKESNQFTDEFFTAARCYTNELESKIVKKAVSNQPLIEDQPNNYPESTNSILNSEECILNPNPIANNISKEKNPKEYSSNQTADQHQSQSIFAESSSSSLILCNNEPPIIVNESLNKDLDKDLDQTQTIQQQNQSINIYPNNNNNRNNRTNNDNINWRFIAIIVALTIICVFTIKNNIDNVNNIWQYV